MKYRRNFTHNSDTATNVGVGMLYVYVLRSTDTIYGL